MVELGLFTLIVTGIVLGFKNYCYCKPKGRSPVTIGDYNLYDTSDVDDLHKRGEELYTLFQKVLRENFIEIPSEHVKETRIRFERVFMFHYAINCYNALLLHQVMFWANASVCGTAITSFDMALKRYVKN